MIDKLAVVARGAERRSARQPTFRPHLPRCAQRILIRLRCGDVHLARAGHKSHLRRRLRRLLFFFLNLLFKRRKKNKRFKKQTERQRSARSVCGRKSKLQFCASCCTQMCDSTQGQCRGISQAGYPECTSRVQPVQVGGLLSPCVQPCCSLTCPRLLPFFI